MKVSTILDQIDLGSIALPKFQRGYVWNRDQVRGLMHSMYKKYPVGSLLVWATKTESADARGQTDLPPGVVKLLLDGQQRMSTLYGIIRGLPPKFFDGNERAFTGLYFHLEEEVFEFYAPMKMKDNPLWINVTELMQIGAGEAIKRLIDIPEFQPRVTDYINRLNAVDSIKETEFHIDEVTGMEKTVDVVVEIFNRVNSGGTKLSKGDLALAKVCASWPEAREEMESKLVKWSDAGFYFKLEWLMRCINTIITGEALFSALENVDTPAFSEGLSKAEKAIDKLLNIISSRLGLDHDRVLGSRYSFPVMARYLMERGGHLADYKERDMMLYWYIHTFLWGRYAGSTESVINQDLHLVEEQDGAIERLIGQLRQNRGDLRLQPSDFIGWSTGARFYPLLYMMTRGCKAKDWRSGVDLSKELLGGMGNLHVHHIFPKSLLYEYGYSRPEVNALANFTFLTQEANLWVSNKDPVEYVPEVMKSQPGAVESHWMPTDPELWRIENFPSFLEARRDLLAQAANDFLDSLLEGAVPEEEVVTSALGREAGFILSSVENEEEERLLKECNEWVVQRGLPAGELIYELTDPETGEQLAIIDLAWPEGLQEGLSQPVALLIDEDHEAEEIVSNVGYRFYTDMDSFKHYVETEILAMKDEGT